mmetsp:Transcript_35347/g.81945  ORF Transcript_35347/g.81945 Transcript_35347/m.81945 type:complete len:308 (-) Transcript_35347:1586-2509(-)
MCVAANEWDEVLVVLNIMNRRNLPQKLSTYRSAIRYCREVGNADASAEILRAMNRAKVIPEGSDVAEVVLTQCAERKWARGLAILKAAAYTAVGVERLRREKRVEGEDSLEGPTPVVPLMAYNAVMLALRPERQWKIALRLLESMRPPLPAALEGKLLQAHPVKDNAVALTGYTGHPRPNLTTFNSVLEILVMDKQMDQTFQLLLSMPDWNVLPSTHTYNLVIRACLLKRNWRRALTLLNTMEEQGVMPNLLTYNSVISACVKSDQSSKAMKLLKRMRDNGIDPDIVTYNAMMSAWAGRYGQSKRTF